MSLVSSRYILYQIPHFRGFAQLATAAASAVPIRIRYPYYIHRSSTGSVPVYSDIRNAGTRYLVLIRNVEGDINALAKDIRGSLFPIGSPEVERMKLRTIKNRHLVIQGGRWRPDVLRWLKEKGF